VLPNYFDGLNSVGDSVLASFVHVQVGGDTFLTFSTNPILEHESGNALALKPGATLLASRSMANATKAPPGAMMTPVPVARQFSGK
jgi:hypothetical protein